MFTAAFDLQPQLIIIHDNTKFHTRNTSLFDVTLPCEINEVSNYMLPPVTQRRLHFTYMFKLTDIVRRPYSVHTYIESIWYYLHN